jgi:hypothetical protein
MLALTGVAVAFSFGIAAAEVPCAADVSKLCKNVAAGGGRIQACLKENEAKLSEGCRKSIDGLVDEVKLLAVVCRWDLARHCSDVTPGAGRAVDCLAKNRGDLSPECAKQLQSMKK